MIIGAEQYCLNSNKPMFLYYVAISHEQVALVQCGASHSLAVTVTGKLYAWGKNSQGQCGVGKD